MNSIYIGEYEYYLNEEKENRYQLISNLKDPFEGRIMDVIMEKDKIKFALKEFYNHNLLYVLYVCQNEDDSINLKYCAREKQGLLANDIEQPPVFYFRMTALYNSDKEKVYSKLFLKRNGKKTIKMIESDTKYIYKDIYDGEEFRIISRCIYDFKNFTYYIPYSMDRIREYINQNKQKKM